MLEVSNSSRYISASASLLLYVLWFIACELECGATTH